MQTLINPVLVAALLLANLNTAPVAAVHVDGLLSAITGIAAPTTAAPAVAAPAVAAPAVAAPVVAAAPATTTETTPQP